MIRYTSTILIIILSLSFLLAQETETDKIENRGDFSGQFRNYFLGTWNKGSIKDYRALASGLKLKYTYKLSNSFDLGAALYSSFNYNIQDLSIPDPQTGKISRYEAGLFGVEDIDQRFIFIPGELYLNYKLKAHKFSIGRMKIKSPFLNPQDGRMIPTLVQGLWYKYNQKSTIVQLGLLNEIAPRSTTRFYQIGKSIGLYPVGRHTNGKPSNYSSNTQSDFVAIANIDHKLNSKLKFEIWDYYVDNLFNTLYIKPTYTVEKNTSISFEWLRQDRVGNGGNVVDSLRYFTGESSNILGAQISRKLGNAKLSIGYDRILPGGRFLFPRAWGREFLFSFQKRERSEGSSDNHALVLYYHQNLDFNNQGINYIFSVGRHWKADLKNAEYNKFALPSYTHFNLDIFWTHKKLPGLKPELLLTYKMGNGDIPNNPNFFHNKVDMYQINFIINYDF